MHGGDGAGPRGGGGAPARERKPVRPQEGCAVRDTGGTQGARARGHLPLRGTRAAQGDAAARRAARGPVTGARAVRREPGSAGAVPPGGPGAHPRDEVPRAQRLQRGARDRRPHGPVRAGEAPPAHACGWRRGRRGERPDERHPGAGGEQHGRQQERGERGAVRVRADDHGRGVHRRPAGAGGEHPRQVPPQPRQQHTLRRAQHAGQGGGGGHAGGAAPPRHHRGVRARQRHLHPPQGAGAGVLTRQ
mmetsp:Transcript_2702/g.9510  ORF Transcript_2702/g.9510 Transcript_2702/m.9510 type:complete len:247 (-) Transcript_2702:960-1700(-)